MKSNWWFYTLGGPLGILLLVICFTLGIWVITSPATENNSVSLSPDEQADDSSVLYSDGTSILTYGDIAADTWTTVVTTDMLPEATAKPVDILMWDPEEHHFVWQEERSNSGEKVDGSENYAIGKHPLDSGAGGGVSLKEALKLGDGVLEVDHGNLLVNGKTVAYEDHTHPDMISRFSLGVAVTVVLSCLSIGIPAYLMVRDTQERRRAFYLNSKKLELEELAVSERLIRRNS